VDGLCRAVAKDKEVADRDTVGHRGTRVGVVDAVRNPGTRDARLRFRNCPAPSNATTECKSTCPSSASRMASGRSLWLLNGKAADEVFEAPAGSRVEIGVPPDIRSCRRSADLLLVIAVREKALSA